MLRILVGHLAEIKADQKDISRTLNNLDKGVAHLSSDVASCGKAVIRADQYHRLWRVFQWYISGETVDQLTTKVSDVLSASGEQVTSEDVSITHRNTNQGREVKGKLIPTSITVKFKSIAKKDSILCQYRNFELIWYM